MAPRGNQRGGCGVLFVSMIAGRSPAGV